MQQRPISARTVRKTEPKVQLLLEGNCWYHPAWQEQPLLLCQLHASRPAKKDCTPAPSAAKMAASQGECAHPGPCNVHAMTASIEQLRQLHKCLHLVTPPAADDGCWEQVCNLAYSVPHLQQHSSNRCAEMRHRNRYSGLTAGWSRTSAVGISNVLGNG